MKRHFSIITIIGLTAGIISCNSSSDNEKSKVDQVVHNDSISKTTKKVLTETDKRDFCTRGQAEPIVKKSVFPTSKFELQADSLTAFETVDFKNGDRLIIHNWGCECYVLTFRFETSRFQKDTTDLEFWFNHAVDLLTEVKSGIDAPINIDKGIERLAGRCESSFHMHYETFKLGDEVDYGGTEIRDYIVVERIEKISEKKYGIEVSFVNGPL